MTFGTSAYLARRFTFAPNGAARLLIAPLAELLGASSKEIDTHEEVDCEDYDPNLVRTIVENLETLTQLPLRPVPRVLN